MSGLEEVWEVSCADLLPHLPLITSILTSRATLPAQLRDAMRLHHRLSGKIDPWLLGRPIKWLPIGKAGTDLVARGIETVGDLIAAAQGNALPAPGTSAGAVCRRALNALGEAIDDCGSVTWQTFGEAMGLQPLPVTDRWTAEDFLRRLNSDLEDVVRATGTSRRAADIFRVRTSVLREVRPTLDRTAELLGGHGSTIKREETDLLAALHTQLVQDDFQFSRVLFPQQFLAWWRRARQIYERSSSDYRTFCGCLSEDWGVPEALAVSNAEGLWAVINRYPSGRCAAVHKDSSPLIAAQFSGGTIVLRGFRRAH